MTWDGDALAALRWHWGDAYRIWHFPGGSWCALRYGGPAGELLRANSADGLRVLMRRDYALLI